jgi:hypothetical protein
MEREMSKTLKIERVGRTAVTAIDLVHSPDDGGYYFSNHDFRNRKSRTSIKIYTTEKEALAEWNSGSLEWEDWS